MLGVRYRLVLSPTGNTVIICRAHTISGSLPFHASLHFMVSLCLQSACLRIVLALDVPALHFTNAVQRVWWNSPSHQASL